MFVKKSFSLRMIVVGCHRAQSYQISCSVLLAFGGNLALLGGCFRNRSLNDWHLLLVQYILGMQLHMIGSLGHT